MASVAVERVEPCLQGHTARSETTIHGWPSVLVGLPAIAAGLTVAAMATGVIAARSTLSMPRPLLGLLGGLFVLVGLSFVTHGVRGLRRTRHMAGGRSRPGIRGCGTTPGIRTALGTRRFSTLGARSSAC